MATYGQSPSPTPKRPKATSKPSIEQIARQLGEISSDEKVICSGRTSYWYYGLVFGMLIVPFFLVVLFGWISGVFGFMFVFLSLAVVIALSWFAKYSADNTFLILTDKRVLRKEKIGFFTNTTESMPLVKVESVSLSQSLFDNLARTGTISINGTGINSIKFLGLANYQRFRTSIQECTGRN